MYYRTLDVLEIAGMDNVSSQKIGEIEGVTAAQVRKDLSAFGSFGCRGFGYNVSELKRHLQRILGLDRLWNVVLIGAGQIGNVFINSEAFKMKNFRITKIFNKGPAFIGEKINNIVVSDIKNLEREMNPETDRLVIIAISPPEVQPVIDRLGKIGVKGVLYFAARSVVVPENMVVVNRDISNDLGTLTYHVVHETKP
ncbi:MAG: redox-sensing transcriptional repressor Rex [Deltaproteobacteria bacterium]|nr:redox-sensing transcriptional repressor Rex [Deltaproteobacteria bacterium]